VEEWLQTLDRLEPAAAARSSDDLAAIPAPLGTLVGYYGYMHKMGKGFIKHPLEREKNLSIVRGWQAGTEALKRIL
jgi:hypothetical protein